MNAMPYGKGYKAPLRLSNERFWKALFDEAKAYLINLKIRDKKGNLVPLHKTQKGTCIRGLLITISSLEGIMEDYVAEEGRDLVYLPTHKLSQDSLELFFGSIRSRFGRNDNPNAVQLEHALKSLICMNIKPNLTGNCLPLDEDFSTKISPLSSTTCRETRQTSTDDFQDLQDELALIDFKTMSLFVGNVVVYISGFVGRKIVKTQKCPSCILSLIPSDFEAVKMRSDSILIRSKDKGGLFIPSEDLIYVCKVTETEIRRYKESGVTNMNRKTIVDSTIRLCNRTDVFTNLRTVNTKSHPLFSDHVYKLIRSIAEYYCKVRLHYIAKEATLKVCPETNRNTCTKAVHFSGN